MLNVRGNEIRSRIELHTKGVYSRFKLLRVDHWRSISFFVESVVAYRFPQRR